MESLDIMPVMRDREADGGVPGSLRWIPEVHAAHRHGWLCHEATSEPPPLPPGLRAAAGFAPQVSDQNLASSDGAHFRTHLARARAGATDGIVVAPDVRGLHHFYETLADRFAEAGVHAIAYDYFGRTFGTAVPPPSFYIDELKRGPFREHVLRTTQAGLQGDLRAASAYLRAQTGARRIFVVGFCFGGRVAFNAAARQPDLAGAIGFYPMPVPRDAEDVDAPSLSAPQLRAPLLGLWGGADPMIAQEDIDALDAAVTRAGVKHKFITYPGAPHSFFDRHYEEHEGACDDAWRRMLGFIASGDPEANTA